MADRLAISRPRHSHRNGLTMTDLTKAIEAIDGVTIVEPLIVIDADGNETEDAIYQVDSPEALKALFEAFESAT